MLFSIIIPTYNYGKYIKRAVDSVFQQNNQESEILVVDDGSTDDTAKIIASYNKTKFCDIHYFTQDRQGPGKARNLGAKQAKGQWLIFLDADDYMAENALAEFKQAIERHPSADAIFANYYRQNFNQQSKKAKSFSLSLATEKNFAAFIAGQLKIFQGAFIIRQNIFEVLGGYAENIFHAEDQVLWGRLIANYGIASIDVPVVYICAHAERLRDERIMRKKEALTYIDLLFDPAYIPAKYMKYKGQILARELLVFAHEAYQSRQYSQALVFYHQAANHDLSSFLNIRQIKRYVITRLRIFVGSNQD